MDAGAQTKADKMHKKTDEMRRMFNLPDTEDVVQDYACAFKGRNQGRMWISQNYLSFHAPLPYTNESIPYRKITDIKKDYTFMFNNAITITTQNETYFFGGFVHRDETFNLLCYLWKHPPSYVGVQEDDAALTATSHSNGSSSSFSSSSSTSASSTSAAYTPSTAFGTSNRTSTYTEPTFPSNNRNSSYDYQPQQQQQVTVKVDTQASKNALRIAEQTRDIGAATMNELSYQAEVIDLIERDVENVHNNLDKADRLVREIESFGGVVKNAFSSQAKGKEMHYVDRTLNFTREEPPVDIEILQKLKNDNLVPAILRFTTDKFMSIDPATNKPENDGIYSYDNIESLHIRARHLHVDIRFKGRTPRYRLCSSYIQAVVNELVLRSRSKAGGDGAKVIFEPGTKQFAYGSYQISPATSASRGSGGGDRKVAFFRNNNRESAQISAYVKNAPQEVRNDLMEQEKDLDQISNILGDLHGMATTMGTEIVRQTEQLGHVTKRVDQADERMHRTNHRMDRIG